MQTWKAIVAAALAAATLCASALAHAATGPVVRVTGGTLQGVLSGSVASFKGVPYAAPPVGPLRWRPPQPPVPWRALLQADKLGAICEQTYQAKDNGVGPLPMSEDCLTLNVYAPAGAKRLPVMVWIHGGGYVNGSGTAALYDGSALARQGVVVVTINYRLGRFGFFAHPALTTEAGEAPVGNYALMDMIAALRWVRENAGRFGGDRRQVTIFGESAGGVAVNQLMVSPAARGLFARAIAESGLGREKTPGLREAEAQGAAFAQSLGLAAATPAQLRAVSAEQILKAGDPDLIAGGTAMVDGQILTGSALDGFRAGREARVPYVIGWNSLEFPAPAAMITGRLGLGSPLTPPVLDRLKIAYDDPAVYDQHLVSDAIFVEPAVALARLHAMRGAPTWVYQFSVLPKAAPAALKGAPHALERQYVFGTLAASPFPTDANDAAQVAAMSAHWASFARSANPNASKLPVWPRFSEPRQDILNFTNQGPQTTGLPRRAALDALAAIYP